MSPEQLRRAEERADLLFDLAALTGGTVLAAGLVGSGLAVVDVHVDHLGAGGALLLLAAGLFTALAIGWLAQRAVARVLGPVRTARRPR